MKCCVWVVLLHAFWRDLKWWTVLWARQRMNNEETKNSIQPIVQTQLIVRSPLHRDITVRQMRQIQDQQRIETYRDYLQLFHAYNKHTAVSLQTYSIYFNSFHSFSDWAAAIDLTLALFTWGNGGQHRCDAHRWFNRRIGWSQKYQSNC